MLLRCLDEARLRSREAPRCQAATASPSAPACDAHLGHRHERLSRSWIQTAWQWAPGHHDSTAACRAVLRQFHFPPPGSTAACGSAALGLPSHLALLLMFGGVETAVNTATTGCDVCKAADQFAYTTTYSISTRSQRVVQGGAASPHCQRQALLRGRALRVERRHVRLVLNQAFYHV